MTRSFIIPSSAMPVSANAQRLTVILLLSAIVATPNVRAQPTASDTLAPRIEWPEFSDALEAARSSGKVVLIDIYSPKCGWCRKMQNEVYTRPELQKFLFDHFEIGRLDISATDDTIAFKGYELDQPSLAAGFGATGTPTTVFLNAKGDYITRLPGFHDTADFMNVLRYVGTRSFKSQSFEEFVGAERDK